MNDVVGRNYVKRCYFCDSPFQIFTCIHFELIEKNESDIYISDNFDGCRELCERLKTTKLFNSVVMIHTKQNKLKNPKIKRLVYRVGILLSYLTLNQRVKSYLIKGREYGEMYFSCHSLHMRLARLYYMKNYSNMKYVMYDEGIGSYVGQFERKSIINCFLERVITRGASDKFKAKRLLYKPELYYKYNAEKESIGKIAPIGQVDTINKNIYEYVFDYKIPKLENIKCIFFDGIREDYFYTEKELGDMQHWYQTIEDIIGANYMLVKTHPRATESYPHKCEVFPTSSCPFEINLLGLNIDNMLLVSLSSSSVVTPKLLFDKEPYVIILAEMYQEHYMIPSKKMNLDFFREIRELYKNKNNFCIPHSLEELKKYLTTLVMHNY